GHKFEKVLQMACLKHFERVGGGISNLERATRLGKAPPKQDEFAQEDAVEAIDVARPEAEYHIAVALPIDQVEHLVSHLRNVRLLQAVMRQAHATNAAVVLDHDMSIRIFHGCALVE